MKAVIQDCYGSADLLQVRDIDTPAVGDDDVLVRAPSTQMCGTW